MAKRPTDTDSNVNRLRSIVNEMTGLKDPDDRMLEVMGVLTASPARSVEPGKLYLFVYNAKTPNITYDQNPFIAVTDVFQWGFRGINFHHQDYRQYTWEELGTQVYIVQQDELDDLLSLQYGKLVLNK